MNMRLSFLIIWLCTCASALAQTETEQDQAPAPDQALNQALNQALPGSIPVAEISQPPDEPTPQASDAPLIEKVAERIAPAGPPEDKLIARPYKHAMIIDVNGPIFGDMQAYINNRVGQAERKGVDLIIFRITSPGGDLNASESLATMISKIDWATTIAFIPEEAYSGAAIVSLGADRIIMEPHALLGDAGPMFMDKGAFRFVEPKLMSKISAEVREIAESNNRPGALAEAMVDHKLVVYEATHNTTGKREYLTAHQIAQPNIAAQYTIGNAVPETGQERFLTVGGSRAVELGMAEATVDSERALLERLKVDQLTSTQRTWVDSTVYLLNRPFVTGLLLLVGLVGLYVEMTVPGISVAGLVSLFCFGIFFWSHALGGTSGWLEVMLFALGVSTLAIEIFVLPGTGIFGLSGVGLIVLSLVMASQDFIFPQSTVQWETMGRNLLIVVGTLSVVGLAFIVQVMFFDWIPGMGRLRLQTPDGTSTPAADTLAALTAAMTFAPEVGRRGLADSVLRPAGKVRFDSHLVDVVTEGDFLDPGTEVEVVKREGNRIIVRRV